MFCLVVQSEFEGHFVSCVVCICRHKLCRICVELSEKRHFVTLIEVNMHLIVWISGRLPISMQIKTSIFPTIVFKTIETHRKSEGENIVKLRPEFLKS